LGYVGFNGVMDFNMLIRTIVADQKQLSFSAGGGIVADSDPAKEYEETLIKAEAMKQAITKVRERYARRS
ncbi:MAG: chorismate-binding protein, partial [Sedimentisphaerales bacterium]|nr:chorismate-binding protein [Sedimentisphaerales bacterium]